MLVFKLLIDDGKDGAVIIDKETGKRVVVKVLAHCTEDGKQAVRVGFDADRAKFEINRAEVQEKIDRGIPSPRERAVKKAEAMTLEA